jgi:hypothetical protein
MGKFIINRDRIFWFAPGDGNGGVYLLHVKQWEIQGYTVGMGYLPRPLGLNQECQKQDDKQPERTGNGKFSNYFINQCHICYIGI